MGEKKRPLVFLDVWMTYDDEGSRTGYAWSLQFGRQVTQYVCGYRQYGTYRSARQAAFRFMRRWLHPNVEVDDGGVAGRPIVE